MDYKLDLTKLTLVPVEERIKGHWYVVADEMNQPGHIRQWYSDDYSSSVRDVNEEGTEWNFWFAIPPGLPGFPKGELPDEFELKDTEWEFKADGYEVFSSAVIGGTYRRIQPNFTIPSITGTRADVIAALEAELSKLKGNG